MSTQLGNSGLVTAPGGRPCPAPEPGIGSLVTGIVGDMQHLLAQHLDLFRQELRDDFRRTKEAVFSLGLGGVLAGLAAALLTPTLVGLLSWAVPAIPWWGWCGILTGVLAVAAGILIYLGKKQLDSFNPLPDQSAQAVKEDVQWISDQVTSDRR